MLESPAVGVELSNVVSTRVIPACAAASKGYFLNEIIRNHLVRFEKADGQIGDVRGMLYGMWSDVYRLQIAAVDVAVFCLMVKDGQCRFRESSFGINQKRIRQIFHSGAKKIDSFEHHETRTHFIRNFFSTRQLSGAREFPG